MQARLLMMALAAAALTAGCSGGSETGLAIIPSANASSAETASDLPPINVQELDQAVSRSGVKQGGLRATALNSNSAKKDQAVATKAVYGWNSFSLGACVGSNILGTDVLYLYMRDGTTAFTTNPLTIAMLAPACTGTTPIKLFVNQVYLDGSFTWQWAMTLHSGR